eukprot:29115-Pelagococcus_subviridis.AAC.1
MGVFSCLAPPPRAASVPPSRKRIPPAADATTTTAAAAPASELSEAGSGDRSPSPSSSFVSRTRSLSDVTAHAIEEERARRQSRAVSDRDLPPPVWDALSDSLLEASARRLRARDPPPEEKRMWETYHALKALAPIPAFGGGGGGEEESGTNNNAHSSGVTNNNNSTERRVPTTPTTLAKLAEDGLMRGDDDWARREDVRALLADDVVYHTADGLTLEGVERVIDKMCDQTARLAKRMKRSRRQRAEGKEGGGGAAAAASMKQAKRSHSRPRPPPADKDVWTHVRGQRRVGDVVRVLHDAHEGAHTRGVHLGGRDRARQGPQESARVTIAPVKQLTVAVGHLVPPGPTSNLASLGTAPRHAASNARQPSSRASTTTRASAARWRAKARPPPPARASSRPRRPRLVFIRVAHGGRGRGDARVRARARSREARPRALLADAVDAR